MIENQQMERACPACLAKDNVFVETSFIDRFISRFYAEHNPDIQDIASVVKSVASSNCTSTYYIYACSACGLQFSDPMVAGTNVFYELLYTYMPRTGLKWEFTEFKQDQIPGKRLLDIGCGDGSFINYACKLGYDAEGIDFDQKRPQTINKRIHFIDIQNLRSFLSSCEQFDVFTLWQVLEHLEDPAETLLIIKEYAKASSILILAVPSDVFYITGLSERPITDYPPHHLTRWNKTALESLAYRTSWAIHKHVYEPLTNGLKTYGQRIAKSIWARKNLLEELKFYLSHKKIDAKLFSPRYDSVMNTLPIKIFGRIIYYFLLLTKRRYTGVSQYAILKRR